MKMVNSRKKDSGRKADVMELQNGIMQRE